MSWIEKELRRRQALKAGERAAKSSRISETDFQTESARITALWDRFESANNALPAELKLRRDVGGEAYTTDQHVFLVWLTATNGSGLGLTGGAIRYYWPEEDPGKRRNFWIRWDAAKGYRLSRRVRWSWSGVATKERRFKESCVDYMIKCLVTNVRVDYKSVSRGRLGWLF